MELKILEIEIDKIKIYENNAKEHPDWQIEQIMNSIETFGFNDPIALNKDMRIIEGHGRYLAAKGLKMSKIPCITLFEMTEEQERAYIIAHNKLTLNTNFDIDKLGYELNALTVESFDLSLTGFKNSEIDSILNPTINAFDTIEEGYSSLADEMKEETEIFTVSFNFPTNKKIEIEKLLKEKGKEYFVNLIIDKLPDKEVV